MPPDREDISKMVEISLPRQARGRLPVQSRKMVNKTLIGQSRPHKRDYNQSIAFFREILDLYFQLEEVSEANLSTDHVE
jgi:hypothetical protein